jgi:hypothetical protein
VADLYTLLAEVFDELPDDEIDLAMTPALRRALEQAVAAGRLQVWDVWQVGTRPDGGKRRKLLESYVEKWRAELRCKRESERARPNVEAVVCTPRALK